VVIGASAGMGLEMARILASRRAFVIATGRTIEKTKAAFAQKQIANDRIRSVVALELADNDSVDRAAQALLVEMSKCAKVDTIFFQAGMLYSAFGPVDHIGADNVDLTYRSNFMGYARLAKRLIPHINKNVTRVVLSSSTNHYGGSVADMLNPKASSESELTMSKRINWYASSKASVQALAREMRNQGVMAATVTPGVVLTDLVMFGFGIPFLNQGLLAYLANVFLFTPTEGAMYTLWAARINLPASHNIMLSPYYLPPWGFFGQDDGSVVYQNLAIVLFEFTQRLYARPGYMWECPEAPFIEKIQASMKQRFFL